MRLLVKGWKLVFLTLGLFASQLALAESKYNMPVGVTPLSRDIYQLHMTIFWICVAIGVVVFSIMFYALIMHRKSRGAVASQFHEHTALEITWAVIPFIILVIMAVPATKVLINMYDSSKSELTIKVTGYQWKWKYDYLDQNISFFSNLSTPLDQIHNYEPKGEHYLLEVDNPMVVPIHKKIRLLITANDVIHSWWVPSLGIKMDGIPGFIHEAWMIVEKPGTYRGQCAELCGTNHAYMPIVVEAKTEEEFEQWVKKQGGIGSASATVASDTHKTWTKQQLMQQGETVYKNHCAICHKPDGSGMPPTFPAITGGKIAIGPKNAHIDIVLKGKRGTAMQAFGAQLSDADIAAVVTYQRNGLGNHTGDLVQPAQVKAARQ